MTETRVVTAKITPSRVKKVRSLWARSVSREIHRVSRIETRVSRTAERFRTGLLTVSTYKTAGQPEKFTPYKIYGTTRGPHYSNLFWGTDGFARFAG